MQKTIGILQPGYLPWLGFFEQVYRSDIFVIYDDVQYDKHGWRNRNRIKNANGFQWLTVPVRASAKPLVKDTQIANEHHWQKKHIAALQMAYSRAPYFEHYFSKMSHILSQEWVYLIDLDVALMEYLMSELGLKRELVFASDLNVAGEQTERLVKMCQALDATRFYEGAAGKNYIDNHLFEAANITLEYQEYEHPTYNQLFGEFVPYLSVVDLLFNHGQESLAILTHAPSTNG